MSAKNLGWDDFFERQLDTSDLGLIRARVSRQNTDSLILLSEIGELTGVLPGKFKENNKGDLPTIGDWVLAIKVEHFETNRVLIQRILARKNILARTEIGQGKRRQLMAANVDRVFIVSGLDKEFNPRKAQFTQSTPLRNHCKQKHNGAGGSSSKTRKPNPTTDQKPRPSLVMGGTDPAAMGPVLLVSPRYGFKVLGRAKFEIFESKYFPTKILENITSTIECGFLKFQTSALYTLYHSAKIISYF